MGGKGSGIKFHKTIKPENSKINSSEKPDSFFSAFSKKNQVEPITKFKPSRSFISRITKKILKNTYAAVHSVSIFAVPISSAIHLYKAGYGLIACGASAAGIFVGVTILGSIASQIIFAPAKRYRRKIEWLEEKFPRYKFSVDENLKGINCAVIHYAYPARIMPSCDLLDLSDELILSAIGHEVGHIQKHRALPLSTRDYNIELEADLFSLEKYGSGIIDLLKMLDPKGTNQETQWRIASLENYVYHLQNPKK